MRRSLPIALALFAAVVAVAVAILRRARAVRVEPGERHERVVSERPLDSMTRDELYELARERDIPGRSKMKKSELVAALGSNSR